MRPSPAVRKSTSSPLALGGVEGEQVRGEVGEEHRPEDDGAAHRRGAALGVVRGRPVVADELAVAALDEEPDEHRRAEQGGDERHRGRDEDGLHAGTSRPTSRSPSQRSPESRLDFSSTTSPGAIAPDSRS